MCDTSVDLSYLGCYQLRMKMMPLTVALSLIFSFFGVDGSVTILFAKWDRGKEKKKKKVVIKEKCELV